MATNHVDRCLYIAFAKKQQGHLVCLWNSKVHLVGHYVKKNEALSQLSSFTVSILALLKILITSWGGGVHINKSNGDLVLLTVILPGRITAFPVEFL